MSSLGIDIHHSNLGSIRIASFAGSQRILPGLQPDSAMEPQPILPGLQPDAPGTQLNSHSPQPDAPGSTKSESQQAFILAWRRAMKSIAEALEHWWRAWCRGHLRGDELPSSSDWDSLEDSLRVVAVESCTQQYVLASSIPPEAIFDAPMHASSIASTVVPASIPTKVLTIGTATIATMVPTTRTALMPASIPTRLGPPEFATEAIHTPYIQSAPALCPMPEQTPQVISPMWGHTAIDTAEDNTAAEQILQALCVLVPVPHSALPEELSPGRVVGRDAARGLLITAAAEHREHLQKAYKAPRLQTGLSKSLQERKRIHASGGVGFDHHHPTQAEDELNDLDLLFRVLLAALKKPREVEDGKGLLQRMPVQPKTATVPEEFHSKFGKRFGQGCRPPWLQMTLLQKETRLHSLLFTKFSLDKTRNFMLPRHDRDKKLRNDACWREFWLSDAELNSVVAETMEEYGRMCD